MKRLVALAASILPSITITASEPAIYIGDGTRSSLYAYFEESGRMELVSGVAGIQAETLVHLSDSQVLFTNSEGNQVSWLDTETAKATAVYRTASDEILAGIGEGLADEHGLVLLRKDGVYTLKKFLGTTGELIDEWTLTSTITDNQSGFLSAADARLYEVAENTFYVIFNNKLSALYDGANQTHVFETEASPWGLPPFSYRRSDGTIMIQNLSRTGLEDPLTLFDPTIPGLATFELDDDHPLSHNNGVSTIQIPLLEDSESPRSLYFDVTERALYSRNDFGDEFEAVYQHTGPLSKFALRGATTLYRRADGNILFHDRVSSSISALDLENGKFGEYIHVQRGKGDTFSGVEDIQYVDENTLYLLDSNSDLFRIDTRTGNRQKLEREGVPPASIFAIEGNTLYSYTFSSGNAQVVEYSIGTTSYTESRRSPEIEGFQMYDLHLADEKVYLSLRNQATNIGAIYVWPDDELVPMVEPIPFSFSERPSEFDFENLTLTFELTEPTTRPLSMFNLGLEFDQYYSNSYAQLDIRIDGEIVAAKIDTIKVAYDPGEPINFQIYLDEPVIVEEEIKVFFSETTIPTPSNVSLVTAMRPIPQDLFAGNSENNIPPSFTKFYGNEIDDLVGGPFLQRKSKFLPVDQLPEAYRQRFLRSSKTIRSESGKIYRVSNDGFTLFKYDPETNELTLAADSLPFEASNNTLGMDGARFFTISAGRIDAKAFETPTGWSFL